jgi:peptide/nickel transport system substrate-binding protein
LRNKRIITFLMSALIVVSGAVTGCKSDEDDYREAVQPELTEYYTEYRKAASPRKNPENAKKRQDTLTVGITESRGRFNPLYSTSIYDSWVTALVFDGLITNDEKGNAIPNVASSWTLSDDGKTYTFKLKEGVKFSDGTELTAEDVEFTYTVLCDPSYSGAFGSYLSDLAGYKDYVVGNASEISGIKVLGKYEISFTFREIRTPVIYDFAIGILPKDYYSFPKGEIDKLEELMTKPLGAGPYRIISYEEGKEIVFKKNPNYFKGDPSIDNIVFKIDSGVNHSKGLISGDIDIFKLVATSDNVELFQRAGYIDLYTFDNNGYHYIGLNLRNDMFKDKSVRQALMYGLDRENFIKTYYGDFGVLTNVPFPRASWAYPEDINTYEYDKAKAQELLEAAGWTLKEDGWRYKDGEKFTIQWSSYQGNKYVERLIPFVSDSWKELGIEVTVEQITFAELVEKVFDDQDFHMYNMSWTLGIDPDPSLIFSSAEDVPSGYNSVGWRNDESEKLLREALRETDADKRKELYHQWAKLINEELPYIFLNQNKELYAVNSRIKNIKLSSYNDWPVYAHMLEVEAE